MTIENGYDFEATPSLSEISNVFHYDASVAVHSSRSLQESLARGDFDELFLCELLNSLKIHLPTTNTQRLPIVLNIFQAVYRQPGFNERRKEQIYMTDFFNHLFVEVTLSHRLVECCASTLVALVATSTYDMLLDLKIVLLDHFKAEEKSSYSDLTKQLVIERWLTCLRVLSETYHDEFSKVFFQDEFLLFLLTCSRQANKYVREHSFYIFSRTIRGQLMHGDLLDKWVEVICMSLGEHWSEVRLAATIASHQLLQNDASSLEKFHGQLVPRWCLNRYHAADRLRYCTHDLWKELTLSQPGVLLLSNHIDLVVQYYISAMDSDHPQIREAACYCAGELAKKLDTQLLVPFVNLILKNIVQCIKDDSWAVREAACSSSSEYVRVFSNYLLESSIHLFSDLIDLYLTHLADNVSAVRENAAIALGRIASLGTKNNIDFKERILLMLRDVLPMAKQQSNYFDVKKFDKESKAAYDNDPAIHSNQLTFSCCAFAPRLKRLVGCEDHGFARTPMPWEYSDGSMYLLREMSALFPEDCIATIPSVIDIATLPVFPHYQNLLENIWLQMSIITNNIGTNRLEDQWKSLMAAAYLALTSENRLAMSAAGGFIDKFIVDIGEEAFRMTCSEDVVKNIRESSFVSSKSPATTNTTYFE